MDQPTSKKYAIALAILLVVIFVVFLVSFFMYIHTFYIQTPSSPHKDVNYSVTRRSDGSLIRQVNKSDTGLPTSRRRHGKGGGGKKKSPAHSYFVRPKYIIDMPRLSRRRSGLQNRTSKTLKKAKRPRPREYGYYGREGMRGRYYPLPAKRFRNASRYDRGMRCPDGAPPKYNIEEADKLPQDRFPKFRIRIFLEKEVNKKWRNRCLHNRCYIDWERYDIICKGNYFQPTITLLLSLIATHLVF